MTGTFSHGVCVRLLALNVAIYAVEACSLDLTGSVRLHDPSRIHEIDGRYYTFSTGCDSGGCRDPIISKWSDNLTHWNNGPGVFDDIPDWAQLEVPNNPGFMWAPDVIHHDGEYRMYYSVSSFGSQNSVIGLATNTTLDFNDPNYAWVDQGLVIESEVGSPYNAIDAGVLYDDSTERMWMSFGSHWGGIYVTELNPDSGKPLSTTIPRGVTQVARNPTSSANAIEAAFLTENEGQYYLFVNWDSCCQGSNSTYKIRVGRSDNPNGPFVDRNGVPMTGGGGELFLATEGDFIGPGHFSDFSEGPIDYFSYHYYDGDDNGRSKLGIREFSWTYDGWPILVEDLPAGDYNRDGLVNAADFTVWRDTHGSSDDLRANGDNSGLSAGVVDDADYLVWANHFGDDYHPPQFSVSVPEPASITVVLGALTLTRSRSCAALGRDAR